VKLQIYNSITDLVLLYMKFIAATLTVDIRQYNKH